MTALFYIQTTKNELRSPEPGNHELFSKVGTSADVLGFLSVTEACSPHLTPAPLLIYLVLRLDRSGDSQLMSYFNLAQCYYQRL